MSLINTMCMLVSICMYYYIFYDPLSSYEILDIVYSFSLNKTLT